MSRTLIRCLLALSLAGAAWGAFAANYVFPGGPVPAGCSGSAGTYTCGSLTLANNDTITIGLPRPATLTVNGNFNIGGAKINAAGLATDLSVVVTGALTVGNQGQINGMVSAASMTNPNNRANLGGSLSTSGVLSLGTFASVAQCAQSSTSAAITLGNNSTVGGVCCGAYGACSSSCVVNNSGAAMPALCNNPPSPSVAGRFNAFDTGTAAGSLSGVIHTKIAGVAFNVAVVAVNAAGSGLATSFAGNVKVELLDSSNNTGALNASTGCRSSWAVAAGTTSSTLTFAASDQSRKNAPLTITNAWRDARVRVSYPATGTATAVGCSSDNFAIRPASFASFSATDATPQTAGTTRTLANSNLTGGIVHKAGQPFTVRATARNGASTPATTANYTGTPTAFVSSCAGPACTGVLGVLTLPLTTTAGVLSTSTASYPEVGAISLQLVDANFASVDAADGSTPAEMSITSPTITVGRFVPDHFDITSLVPPVLRTFNSSSCASRSFTYLGQPFGYATAPQATVVARNAAGGTTVNYANFAGLSVFQTFAPLISATPGLDSSVATTPANTPTLTPVGGSPGTARLALPSTAAPTLTMVRSPSTPVAPFDVYNDPNPNLHINLIWIVTDGSEAAAGNGSITTPLPLAMNNIPFDAGSEFRYGVLKLGSAYGSELVNLAVPLELQYWNSNNSFVTNAGDSCTTLATSSLALGPYRSNLAACETAPGAASITFSGGRGLLRMLPPGSGNSGSVDGTINLGAAAAGQRCSAIGASASAATTANMPWLQGKSGAATTYSVNPSARFSFGQYRSPLIHLREVY